VGGPSHRGGRLHNDKFRNGVVLSEAWYAGERPARPGPREPTPSPNVSWRGPIRNAIGEAERRTGPALVLERVSAVRPSSSASSFVFRFVLRLPLRPSPSASSFAFRFVLRLPLRPSSSASSFVFRFVLRLPLSSFVSPSPRRRPGIPHQQERRPEKRMLPLFRLSQFHPRLAHGFVLGQPRLPPRWNANINARVLSSATNHWLTTMLRAPAICQACVSPTSTSPRESVPRAVWQPDRTTNSARSASAGSSTSLPSSTPSVAGLAGSPGAGTVRISPERRASPLW